MRDVKQDATEDEKREVARDGAPGVTRVATRFERGLSRERLLEAIPNPERFRPKPVVLKPYPRRVLPDGSVEVPDARSGGWRPLHALLAEVHDALEAGCDYDEVFARALPKSPKPLPAILEKTLRSYFWDLHEAGFIRIPLDAPPAVFAGRYERLKELGRGGMGVAHLCRDIERDGALVVVKHAWGWSRPIERAEHTNRWEAVVMADLDHPVVPRLRDTFEVAGILHMVRDYADGAPMLASAKRLVAMTPHERARIMRQLVQGIDYVHSRGYLYLDAKPGNIILLADGRPMILDFGIARELPADGRPVRLRVGSPGFTAPEIRKSKLATRASDQFSLGCVHFFMATGGRPRRGWGPDGIRDALETQGVDASERRIIERMTAWAAADRYPDLQAAEADLGRVAS